VKFSSGKPYPWVAEQMLQSSLKTFGFKKKILNWLDSLVIFILPELVSMIFQIIHCLVLHISYFQLCHVYLNVSFIDFIKLITLFPSCRI
jgi:hypothetical protein